MIRFWFLFIFLFFCSCDSCKFEEPIGSEKQRLADAIIAKVAFDIRKKTGMRPCGSGGRMMYDIKMLALGFDYYKEADIETCRELLLTAAEAFVNAINADEQIQPFLSNRPYTIKNVEIRIFLRKPDGSQIENDKLHVVSIINGKLEYDIRSAVSGWLETILKETYEEAVEKRANHSAA
jgi:hypothetical protein